MGRLFPSGFAAGHLSRQLVPDGTFDFENPPDRRARHHALVVGAEAGVGFARGVDRFKEAPKKAEEVDVGD
jgi:hypothetical protein